MQGPSLCINGDGPLDYSALRNSVTCSGVLALALCR